MYFVAYVNEKREGMVLEKPLIMGEIRANNNNTHLDVGDEISLLLKSSSKCEDATKFYRKLGQQRYLNIHTCIYLYREGFVWK